MIISRVGWFIIGLVILAAIVAHSSGSFAQDAAVTTGSSGILPEGTEIRIPWGAWLSDLSSTLATILMAVVIWLFRRLPGSVVAILQTLRAEQLIQKAIDYGLNATAGAAKDNVLTVEVGNEVIAKAATYAIDNGAPYIIKWLGGTDGITKKIVARLELEPEAQIDEANPTPVAQLTR
jgi:hypothetical protein